MIWTSRDTAAVMATAAISAASVATVGVPGDVAAYVTAAVAVCIFAVRVYASRVGPANTNVDDAVDAAEDAIIETAKGRKS